MKANDTFVKQSKKQICSITLKELESKNQKFEFISDKGLVPESEYVDLVLFSPSRQSNLGEKLSTKIQKHIDELVRDIVHGLDVKQIFFYASFESQKGKNDLSEKIKNSSHSLIAIYCPDSFTESLYSSIRNALAHGNIAKKGKYYYLYSVSSKAGKDCPEENRNLTFLLKIHDITKIKAYVDGFNKYNR